MEVRRKIVSLSLSAKTFYVLNKFSQKENKTRSEIVRNLINRYLVEKDWQEIFKWGKETAKKFKIRSEADVLKLIND